MSKWKIMFIWAIAFFANIQTQSAEVKVGGQNISIPSPSGFSEISSISPEIFQLFKDMGTPTNRLLAVFISQEDIRSLSQGEDALLDSFMTIESVKKIEFLSLTEVQFKELRTAIRSQFYTMFEEQRELIDKLADNAGRSISKTNGEDVNYNVGDIVPLGIDSETDTSIIASGLTTHRVTVGGESTEDITAATWCTLLVNGKVISLYVYKTYNEASELEWTRQMTQSWTNSILSANNIITPLGSPSKSYVTPSLIIVGLFAIGGGLLSLSRKPKIEGEERERCLAYTKAVTNISAFWDRESTLFNNTLVKYLDSITENPIAASEVCSAANRLVQAANEVIRRHEEIQSIPDASLPARCAYSTSFLILKEWAENNLAAIEALANGLTPHYEYVQQLMENYESAWHEAQNEEQKLLKRLGLTGHEIEANFVKVHSSLEAAKNDSWHPETCTYEFSNNAKGIK